METLTVNLSGKVRRETLNGREHLVAPLTMIVPGVLNGSNGPLFYPLREIEKNAEAWNGVPIVKDHPQSSNGMISARTPEILNKQGIGVVLQARVNGKLTAEGWFDIENTKRIDSRIIDDLLAGKKIELSTGLSLDEEKVSGTFKGEDYRAIARNFRPDHLAVFVDKKGACSVDDGCGVLNEDDPDEKNLKAPEDGEAEEELEENDSKLKENEMTKKEVAKKKVVDNIIENCGCHDESDRETLNAFDDKKLETITASVAENQANSVIASAVKEGAEAGNNSFTFNVEKCEFVSKTVENAKTENPHGEDDDLEELEGKKSKNKESKNKETKNEEIRPMTENEWYEVAPPSVRASLEHSNEIIENERQVLIRRVVNNQEADQRERVENEIKEMDLKALRFQASLLPAEKQTTSYAPSYAGAAVPVGAAVENIKRPEPMPEVNWAFGE